MRVEHVGNVCAVGPVLMVNVSGNRLLLGLVAGVAVVVMAKTPVCM